MKRYDIIISGGGMIGSIAAVAAINAGLSVLLIEARAFKEIHADSPKDLRVSAISWNNICTLKELGIFDGLLTDRIQSYSHMQVWDNRTHAEIDFSADFSQQQCLGYLMENINLIQAAWKKLRESDNCETIEENTIQSLENNGLQVRIVLTNGAEYKSRLLIAAEGRNSLVRTSVGIEIQETPYYQKGLVAYITLDKAPTETALQAFNQGGPIGILPIKGDMFSIVWSLPEEQSQHWLDCDQQTFEQGVKTAIGKDLGNVNLISKRAAFALTQLYADKYFEHRVVLCGDTAHGVHPLAGQGVNLGIGDIKQLFEVIDMKALKDQDLLRLALRKYQRRRTSQVKETSEMMSALHLLFKDDKHIKKPLRTMGLKLLNKSPMKKWFISQAGS
ncbi:MAG: FAD-dependent monooxygenase [Proteobacteria bacterium]|nr:FAD-dependent monooxygenase [Pseudomonadota bacterium]